MNVHLPPNKRRILYVTMKMTDDLLKVEKGSYFRLNEKSNSLVTSGELRSKGLPRNYSFLCKANVALPKVLVSDKKFDFGTGFIGDTYKLEIFSTISQLAIHFIVSKMK